MLFLFLGLLLFFAVRAFFYFRGGRAFAGTFAVLACLLFTAGIYTDIARHTQPRAQAVQPTA
jgi:hypothetical protein